MTVDTSTRLTPRSSVGEVTAHLRDWYEGDDQAPSRLLPLVYEDLCRIAHAYSRSERRTNPLQPTAVVHEAWIQLIDYGIQDSESPWQSREHFLGIAARIMRRVLVDYARFRGRDKRGARFVHVPLWEETDLAATELEDRHALYLAIDQALERLEGFAPQEARVVELKFFGGLTLDQIAEFIGVSRSSVIRLWKRARAWLQAELEEGTQLDT